MTIRPHVRECDHSEQKNKANFHSSCCNRELKYQVNFIEGVSHIGSGVTIPIILKCLYYIRLVSIVPISFTVCLDCYVDAEAESNENLEYKGSEDTALDFATAASSHA